MGYWNSRGLRGSSLEEIINFTNDIYRQKKLALIQKIPTPITPVKIDSEKRIITLGYFERQSTVDYIGVVQGIPVCFDAKDTTQKSFPLQNIHEHQIKFMNDFIEQGGLAFLLVHFSKEDEFFMLTMEILMEYRQKAKDGGRKSIPYSAFDKRFLIKLKDGAILEYLTAIDTYLSEKADVI